MKIFSKIKRYAALATGNFEKIFKDKEIPPLPEAVMKLMEALRDPECSIDRVASIVGTDPGLSAQVLRMANSPLYGLKSEVKSVKQAISTLGLKRLENIAISYGVRKAVKDPKVEGFDFNLFWSVSLYRAIMGKELSQNLKIGDPDEAFTGALLQDIALPVLLKDWFKEYKIVYEEWKKNPQPLSAVENKKLSWNHAQAGAWMAKKWGFPAILVCAIGLHNESLEKVKKLGLEATSVVPVLLSSRMPMRNPEAELEPFTKELAEVNCSLQDLLEMEERCYNTLVELASGFNIRELKVERLPDQLAQISSSE